MASITLRPAVPARARAAGAPPNVEALTALHIALVRERQELRSGGAELDELERNRLAIVGCQWELSLALIERHLGSPPASHAA
jgi:hypothetical protein